MGWIDDVQHAIGSQFAGLFGQNWTIIAIVLIATIGLAYAFGGHLATDLSDVSGDGGSDAGSGDGGGGGD